MSLPPQSLKIKRKRVDDPVDSLFLEPRGSRQEAKRRTTEHSFVFRRLSITQEPHQDIPSRPPAIPQIRSTLPGEENEYYAGLLQRSTPNFATANVDDSHVGPIGVAPRQNHVVREPTIAPRLFRLARARPASSDTQSEALNPALAVFVEKRTGVIVEQGAARGTVAGVAGKQLLQVEAPTPPKRPSGRIFRRQQERKERIDTTPDVATEAAMEQMATDMVAEEQAQHSHNSNGLSHEADVDIMDMTDDADYVYDTFIRAGMPATIGSTNMDTTASALIKGGVGYLIIEEEDQDLWETYAEGDSESEQDWDSEQDDENGERNPVLARDGTNTDAAENFYGADYPEDEIDQDDEFDQQAYKYRHKGAADEEEYGSESDVYSDDSDVKRYPRKRHPWRELEDMTTVEGSDDDDEDEKV